MCQEGYHSQSMGVSECVSITTLVGTRRMCAPVGTESALYYSNHLEALYFEALRWLSKDSTLATVFFQ